MGRKAKTILHKPISNYWESWELSTVEGDVSVVSNGYLKENQ
jgi:mannose-6-phosphate isomerase